MINSNPTLFNCRGLAPFIRFLPLIGLFLASLFACSPEKSSAPELKETDLKENTEWPSNGGDAGKSYHSSLKQIDRANVNTLGLAWEFDLETMRGQEATPLLVDGIMVVSSNLGRVYAIDPKSGKEVWRFIPKVDMQINRTACCDQVNRGVAIKNGVVYVASLDGVLYALDLKDGQLQWQANTVEGMDRGQTITGAPEIAGNVVIIGNGGAEYGVRGYVSAYDLASGELKWRFFTVPRDPKLGPQENPELEQALKTWAGSTRWELGLGGTVWDAIHYDKQFNVVYIGVGNGGPYHAKKRSSEGGDQLFLGSIVALDPENGRVKWYYQQTPGDSWDYTSTQPMILTDLNVDGETVPALIHAPKNGFMYVFDRRDGRLLKANPIVYQNWTEGLDPVTGKPKPSENADYFDTPKLVFPATAGARNWHPASWHPGTGLYYASVQDLGNVIMTSPRDKPYKEKSVTHDAALMYATDLEAMLPSLPTALQNSVKESTAFERISKADLGSFLRAINPLTGETVWSVKASSWQDRAGVLTTDGGLVFQGDVTGRFSVFDVNNGALLHSMETGTSILAAPMTYMLDGEQYVAITAGWGGGGWPFIPKQAASYTHENRGRLLVFKLNGSDIPFPKELAPLAVAPEPPKQLEGINEADIQQGQALYYQHCILCHANQQRTMSADLRRMRPEIHAVFNQIVLNGGFLSLGMPRWNDVLSEDETKNIHAFLIQEQSKVRDYELELEKEGLALDSAASGVLSSF